MPIEEYDAVVVGSGILGGWAAKELSPRPGTIMSNVTPAIAGSREGLTQLPDGEFQPAMPLNCGPRSATNRPCATAKRRAAFEPCVPYSQGDKAWARHAQRRFMWSRRE